jgi:type IV pilus assembly protein PilE
MGTTTSRSAVRGITLIELMIALVVIGVLAAVAYPSFQSQVRKSRRSEAFTALAQLQQAQERYRSGQPGYADNTLLTAAPTASPPGLGLAATTPSNYYDIAIVSVDSDGTGYIAKADAHSGTSQASDSGCTTLVVSMYRGQVTYGAGSTTRPLSDSNKCWAR